MRSMTGFGQGVCQVGGRRLDVEIRSVNHRFFDLKLRLARLGRVDPVLPLLLQRRVPRKQLRLANRPSRKRNLP